MIDFLTWALVLLVFIQPNLDRFYLAAVFAILTQMHNTYLSDLDGLAYFASAALFDLLILSAAAAMPKISGFAMRIGIICAVSVLLNIIGAVLWALEYPPVVYDSAYIPFYMWAAWIFIKRDHSDVGNTAVGRWVARFCGYCGPGGHRFDEHEGPL